MSTRPYKSKSIGSFYPTPGCGLTRPHLFRQHNEITNRNEKLALGEIGGPTNTTRLPYKSDTLIMMNWSETADKIDGAGEAKLA